MLNTCSIGRRWKPREGWSRPVLTGERGTLFPIPSWGLGLVLWWFSRWMARNAVSCGHDDTGKAFRLRPLSGSRTATTGIGRVAGSVAGRSVWSAVQSGFAVVMAQVRRPVPFRTRKLRPGRGDGTALERVWESSTPPHSTVWTFWSSPLRDSRKVPFFIRTGCFPPPGGGLWTSASRPAGGFLQWVEVFGLWKACGRTGYSSEWRNLDRERLGSGRIPPVSGGIWDVERCVGR